MKDDTNNCPKCGSYDSWSRWMKRHQVKDHRQYRFCTQCYYIQYREQPKRLRDRVKREWR
jgi:Zn ribbon nucleic-acid-binding protein